MATVGQDILEKEQSKIGKEKGFLKRVAIAGCALFCCRVTYDNNFEMIIVLKLLDLKTHCFFKLKQKCSENDLNDRTEVQYSA